MSATSCSRSSEDLAMNDSLRELLIDYLDDGLP
ncbi:MAG: hypothetical protein ACI9EF_002617, partial [Pseudohongiellaceae bacterium]